MSTAKRGLGRGLDALISHSVDIAKPVLPLTSGKAVVQLDVLKIIPNPRQPRKEFDAERLDELAQSIKEQGIASPILVRKKGESYELIAGERRLRAAKKAGITSVPAIIKDFTDEQSLEIAIVENLQREDLNPIEEALAYRALTLEFGLTHEVVAKKVGKSRAAVTNSLRLLDLPKEIRESINNGEISPGHARPLLSIQGREKQLKAWKEILKKNLSVRDVEAALAVSDKKPGARKAKKVQGNPFLADIEERLRSGLSTKVEVSGTEQKGTIKIKYYSKDDLERIIEKLG